MYQPVFLFMLISRKRKVLQIINRKTVCSFSSHLLSVAVCQVLVQHGLRDLCPWGIALHYLWAGLELWGIYQGGGPLIYSKGRYLILYIFCIHCESSKYVCWRMSETVYVEIIYSSHTGEVLFCLGWLSSWYRYLVQKLSAVHQGGNLGLNAVLSLVNVSCVNHVFLCMTLHTYIPETALSWHLYVKDSWFQPFTNFSTDMWFHCS